MQMDAALLFVLGVLVRIGIPVAATVLLVVLLRKLDQRWQKESQSLPVIPSPAKRCWEIKDCPAEQRERCPAAAQEKVPCWQVFRSKSGMLREECLACEVFRQAPVLASA